eukprot:759931-Hanusia_phi.AAC.1
MKEAREDSTESTRGNGRSDVGGEDLRTNMLINLASNSFASSTGASPAVKTNWKPRGALRNGFKLVVTKSEGGTMSEQEKNMHLFASSVNQMQKEISLSTGSSTWSNILVNVAVC